MTRESQKQRAQKQKRDKQLISFIFLNISCSFSLLFPSIFHSILFPLSSLSYPHFGTPRGHGLAANSCDTLGSHGNHEAVVGPHLTAFREHLIFSQREFGTVQGVSSSQVDPSLLILFMMSLVKGYLKFEDGQSNLSIFSLWFPDLCLTQEEGLLHAKIIYLNRYVIYL